MGSVLDSYNDLWRRVFRKEDRIVSRFIAGETILVPIRGELADMQRIFVLDEVGEYIWKRMDGVTSLAEIRDGILADFEVEKDRADSDVEEFIGELLGANLIVEAS